MMTDSTSHPITPYVIRIEDEEPDALQRQIDEVHALIDRRIQIDHRKGAAEQGPYG